MLIARDIRTILLVAALAWAAGCDSSNDSNANADAGTTDGAATADLGPPLDSASSEDGLPSPDQGTATCPEGATFTDDLRKIDLNAYIDGKGPLVLIYDTGASNTTLPPEITGQPLGTTVQINEIDLGNGVKLGPVPAYTYPLPTSTYYDGIIGNDAFAGRVVSIDYGRNLLWVDDTVNEAALTACSHVSEPTTIPYSVTPQYGYLVVKGEVDGVEGNLLFDTGASLGGIEEDVLEQTALDHPKVEGYWMNAFIGQFWSAFTMVGEISLGGYTAERIVMYTLPDSALSLDASAGEVLATLPYGFLHHFLITIDFRDQTEPTIRLAPIKGQSFQGDYTLYGYGFSLSVNDNGPVTITNIVPGSPADEVGLAVGDVVLKIGTQDPASVPPKDRIKLGVAAPTVEKEITVQGDDGPVSYSLISKDVFASFP